MGIIKTITNSELGGIDNTPIYPVTHVKAVYDDNNTLLESIIENIENQQTSTEQTIKNLKSTVINVLKEVTNINNNGFNNNVVEYFTDIVNIENAYVGSSPMQGEIVWNEYDKTFIYRVRYTEEGYRYFKGWSTYNDYMHISTQTPLNKLFKKDNTLYYWSNNIKDLIPINSKEGLLFNTERSFTLLPGEVTHDLLEDSEDLEIHFISNVPYDSSTKPAFLYYEPRMGTYHAPSSSSHYNQFKLSLFQTNTYDVYDNVVFYCEGDLKLKRFNRDLGVLVDEVNNIEEKLELPGYVYLGIVYPNSSPVPITNEDKFFYIAVVEGDYRPFRISLVDLLTIFRSINGVWVSEPLGVYFRNHILLAQELGESTELAISQKAVTLAVNVVIPKFNGIIEHDRVNNQSTLEQGEIVFIKEAIIDSSTTRKNIFACRNAQGSIYLSWLNENMPSVYDYMEIDSNGFLSTIPNKLFEYNKLQYVFDGTELKLLAVNNIDGYTYISTANPSTVPQEITANSKVFYIATEKGSYTNFGLGKITEMSVIKSVEGSWKVEGLEYRFELKDVVNIDEDSLLNIVDGQGNIVVKIDKNGISATSVKVLNENGDLESVKQDFLSELYEDSLFITDKDGNVILKIDKNGIASPNITINGWAGKVLATYGDSVTAINNGDYKYPYNGTTTEWANYTARHLNISRQYGRGIGGQKYAWKNGGGSLCWVSPSGSLIERIDNQSFDSWDGTYPSGITAEMEANGEAARTRGCMSSWHRITHQFPESIKDSIDVVLVMAHNDDYDTTNWLFVENDTTDTEWATSGAEYYGAINGDYNISTLEGGILSTLMKLQIWMPNAIIVLMTGVSGEGTAGELLPEEINKARFRGIAETVRNMGKLASIPVIDTFATDGINGWNRTKYISDSIHPYTIAGGKMLARAVIGGLKSIIPNFKQI